MLYFNLDIAEKKNQKLINNYETLNNSTKKIISNFISQEVNYNDYINKRGFPEAKIEDLSQLLESKGVNLSDSDLKDIIILEINSKMQKEMFNQLSKSIKSNYNSYLGTYVDLNYPNEKNEMLLCIFKEYLKSKKIFKEQSDILLDINDYSKNQKLKYLDEKYKTPNKSITLERIDLLSGVDFENLLIEIYKKKGYSVKDTPKSTDYGADLVLEKYGKKTVIQAKCWSNTVGEKAVQEIVAAVKHYSADEGVVITNNYFSKPAMKLAHSNNIKLIDRNGLKELIK